jgi:hypothetical protein
MVFQAHIAAAIVGHIGKLSFAVGQGFRQYADVRIFGIECLAILPISAITGKSSFF